MQMLFPEAIAAYASQMEKQTAKPLGAAIWVVYAFPGPAAAPQM